MQSTEDRVNLWEQWMNRRKLFSRKELDEMKDHLLEEIDYLMTHEGLSEQEAFHKSVDIIGMKKELIEEESKVKKESIKRKWQVSISCLVALCFVGLSVFAIQYAFQKRSQVAGNIPYGYPCDGDIEIPYGYRIHPIWNTPDWHTGIDFKLPLGSDVIATANGIVMKASYLAGYGNFIEIQHTDQIFTRYAHCSELLIKKGDTVTRGQVIAKAGKTGVATFSQVHYEIIINGDTVNPEEFNKNVYANQIKYRTSKIDTKGECAVTFNGYPCEGDIDTPTKTIEFRNADRSSSHKERRVCFNVKDIVNIHNSSHPVDVQNTETGAIIIFFPEGTRLPDDLSSIDFSLKTP